MASEHVFAANDFRSAAQDYKRDATKKHKWALGAKPGVGRAVGHPRPHRPSDNIFSPHRREIRQAVTALEQRAKVARKQDIAEVTSSDDSAMTTDDDLDPSPSPPADANLLLSFDAAKTPTQGSQILNVALAKAVEKWERGEVDRIVKREYEVLDSQGESVAKRKGKSKAVHAPLLDDEDEYEFI
ncbi:hypothetical protein LTR50_002076 [Elasticomyces elasticus]|nr:hypothetical protein LTR50_002076 [Elasticomyces elasticus]